MKLQKKKKKKKKKKTKKVEWIYNYDKVIYFFKKMKIIKN